MPASTVAIPVQFAGTSHKGRVIAEVTSTPTGNYLPCTARTRMLLRNTTAAAIPVSFVADAVDGVERIVDIITVPGNATAGTNGRLHLGPFDLSKFGAHQVTDPAKDGLGVMMIHSAAAGAILIDAYEEKQ